MMKVKKKPASLPDTLYTYCGEQVYAGVQEFHLGVCNNRWSNCLPDYKGGFKREREREKFYSKL